MKRGAYAQVLSMPAKPRYPSSPPSTPSSPRRVKRVQKSHLDESPTSHYSEDSNSNRLKALPFDALHGLPTEQTNILPEFEDPSTTLEHNGPHGAMELHQAEQDRGPQYSEGANDSAPMYLQEADLLTSAPLYLEEPKAKQVQKHTPEPHRTPSKKRVQAPARMHFPSLSKREDPTTSNLQGQTPSKKRGPSPSRNRKKSIFPPLPPKEQGYMQKSDRSLQKRNPQNQSYSPFEVGGAAKYDVQDRGSDFDQGLSATEQPAPKPRFLSFPALNAIDKERASFERSPSETIDDKSSAAIALGKSLFGGNLHTNTVVKRLPPSQLGSNNSDVDRAPADAPVALKSVPQPEPSLVKNADVAPEEPRLNDFPKETIEKKVPRLDVAGRELLVFFSAHGGSGTSTLACNMAANLARAGRSVCLVDLDFQLGDALTMLNLEPKCPMSRIAREMESFDWEMLGPMLSRHRLGVNVVSQVGYIEQLNDIDPARLPLLLRYLHEHFEVVIIDGVRDFNDNALAAMDVATQILLVVTQDVPAVHGATRRLNILRRLGYPSSKVKVVVNRHSKGNPIDSKAIGQAIGIVPTFTVANDFPTVNRAITEGIPLFEVDEGARVSADVEQMTNRLFDINTPQTAKKSWWSRFFKRG